MNVEDRALDRLPVTPRSACLHAGRLLSSGIGGLLGGERMHEQVFHEGGAIVTKCHTASAALLSMIREDSGDFLQSQRQYREH